MSASTGFAASFFERPLALHPGTIDAIRVSMGSTSAYGTDCYRQYGLIQGVAIIPIQGVLSKAPDWCEGTSYDWIREGFDCALQDPDVRAIAFDVNSPGGTVEGCFDLADHIYEARGIKPICAILSECAYSAAYALASCADIITIPRTGGAGSIGIVSCLSMYRRCSRMPA